MNSLIHQPLRLATNTAGSAMLVVLTLVLFMAWPVQAQARVQLIEDAPLTEATTDVTTQPVSMAVSPEQCVTLHQGQDCYVVLSVNWQAPTVANYCLFSSEVLQPLQCWRAQAQGEFKQEIMVRRNIKLALRIQGERDDLADGEVKIAWVYKKKGKPRMSWRMF
ncbi:DUF3019 domain-containing protein [Psychrobium sp. 1_MG-2023]|uniref:DUF3019 domain-containing protein n=1 Tax=Psychrobium sp. 1_MG-2023 TaxID=3062624 RepID=UPI0026B85CDC|nr:DUF3019 domain-containing protein [Psychrobium sp. 1_MG-2023]MDP2562928.1 DUF3019 domain-containing protein [Psychrobium sp. 1_MG-2023]